jgi:hypothetical protein
MRWRHGVSRISGSNADVAAGAPQRGLIPRWQTGRAVDKRDHQIAMDRIRELAGKTLVDRKAIMATTTRFASDQTARSWNHLNELLYAIPRDGHDRHRSNYVYRGLANADWSIETSLARLGAHHAGIEEPALRSFRKYAEPGAVPTDQLLVQLAIAQHHGLPTRLIDWTLSPRVAVHFATAEEEHFDKPGAIWCIDIVRMRALLPEPLLAILERRRAWLFSVEMLAHVATLAEFDNLADEHGPFLLFFEPPSLDGRITNQAAIMSIMPGASLNVTEHLAVHPSAFHRIIIPRELKWEVRDKLDQDNVTERMLFPGLDGLARWLKRYYGGGPKGRATHEAVP